MNPTKSPLMQDNKHHIKRGISFYQQPERKDSQRLCIRKRNGHILRAAINPPALPFSLTARS